MGYTSIRVTEELADELHSRKERGDSYEDVIWRLIESDDEAESRSEVNTESAAAAPKADNITGPFDASDVDSLEFRRELTEARASVLVEWLNWAAEQEDGVQKSDFEDAFWSERHKGESGYAADTFWGIFTKPAMEQLDSFGQPNTRTHRYNEQ